MYVMLYIHIIIYIVIRNTYLKFQVRYTVPTRMRTTHPKINILMESKSAYVWKLNGRAIFEGTYGKLTHHINRIKIRTIDYNSQQK